MTLIAAGQNTRNRAMLGLQAMSQEEAEREALYQQMRQAQKAQNAQLAGTGLGIAGSYAANNPEVIKGAATSIGQKLGLLEAAPAGGFFSTTGGGAALAQSANAAGTGATAVAPKVATVGGFFSPTGGGAALAQGANTVGTVAGTTGTVAGTTGATTAAGSLAPLAAMAGPLAIGLGAFFLLNKLFD